MATRHDTVTSVGLLILRVGVGAFMATHGWGKLQMIFDGKFDQFGDPLGLGSGLSLVLATGAEFFCALLVAIGLATRFAAAPVVFTMAIAAFVVHASDPWTMQPQGASKEPALLFLIPMLALVFTGPGRFSLDAILWPRLRQWWKARRKSPNPS
ncbi:MAG: DoxX family protein [Phycisphaerales bacterium JB039]